jgi:hypothetical protein
VGVFNPSSTKVRGMRFEGKSRLLRRMLLGVIASLELEDASPTSAALAAISKWVDEAARREAERADARRARYLARYGRVPAWVEKGMGEREARAGCATARCCSASSPRGACCHAGTQTRLLRGACSLSTFGHTDGRPKTGQARSGPSLITSRAFTRSLPRVICSPHDRCEGA